MSLHRLPAGSAPSLRRGALAATAVAFSLVSLAACSAGNDAQTMGVRPDNAEAAVDDIKIQNANVITLPEEAEGPATVTAKIFNNGRTAQTLDSVSVSGAGSRVKLTPAKGSGPLTIPAGGSLLLGGKGNASAVLESGRGTVEDGAAQPVVFNLSRTGAIKMKAFVVPATGYYEKFGPTPTAVPSASESLQPSGSPSGSASESASPSGGASESPEAGTSEAAAGAGESPAAGQESGHAGH